MSLNTITNAALARRLDFTPMGEAPKSRADIAHAAHTEPKSGPPSGGSGASTTAAQPADIGTVLNVISGYIPTEILTLYVAVLQALHPKPEPPFTTAWNIFWFFLILTPIVVWVVYATKLRKSGKPIPISLARWPVWEMIAATIAYVAWAFALPGSPFESFADWYSSGLAAVVVLVTSTLLGLVAPLFQQPLDS